MQSSPSTIQDLVGEFLRRLGTADAEGVADLFADEIDWRVGGDPRLPWTGTRSRRSEIVPYFRTLWENLVPGASTTEVRSVLVSGDDAVVLGSFTHTAASTGRRYHTPAALHFTAEEGKLVRLHLYEDTFAVSRAYDG